MPVLTELAGDIFHSILGDQHFSLGRSSVLDKCQLGPYREQGQIRAIEEAELAEIRESLRGQKTTKLLGPMATMRQTCL